MLLSFNSCKIFYPNFLLRDTKDFAYSELQEVEYQKQVILPKDRISFTLSTRDGFNLVDVLGGGAAGGGGTYLVKDDGYVELPLLGELYVKGYTRLELEKILEEKFSVWYNDPFIQLTVTNSRVYIFSGVGGASVFSLPEENTTLIQLIASIGGINSESKSYNIKIIRGDYDSPSIKRIDFSTIAGLKEADFVILPNDIIVIESKLRPGQALSRELGFLFSWITAITTVYLLVLSIIKQ
ncbi:MAG TPA: polysaccharide biosynthesis/export family protein [Chitinophagales bacterium]|nr:polysaccharide biosynthesis/export family protein [Chitinophagales bacterium]